MSSNRIAARYAKSLLDLAVEQNALDKVREDIAYFEAASASKDLQLLLKSPIVNVSKKESIFKVLFESKFNKLTTAFFTLVLKKGREANLLDIAKEFKVQYNQLIGLTTVKLTTATPIDAANLESIKAKLTSSKETAKSVEITTKVNPDIIGGFILEIGDKLFDNSIAHKLNQIKKSVSSTDYIKTI
jgi:F-type H+-transporting ATPase subunit delta